MNCRMLRRSSYLVKLNLCWWKVPYSIKKCYLKEATLLFRLVYLATVYFQVNSRNNKIKKEEIF